MGRVEAFLTPERKRFIRFCVVGASGVGVNLLFVWVGMLSSGALGLPEAWQEVVASALGIAVSVLTNFVLNDVWTWGDRAKGPRKRDFLARLGLYYVASGVATAIQFGCAQVLAQTLDVNIYGAQMVGIAIGTLFNYNANNRVTFKDRGDAPGARDDG